MMKNRKMMIKSGSITTKSLVTMLLFIVTVDFAVAPFSWLLWGRRTYEPQRTVALDAEESYRLENLRIQHLKISQKASKLYILANHFVTICNPRHTYNDMNILNHLLEKDKYGKQIVLHDLIASIRLRMSNYLRELEDIYTTSKPIIQRSSEYRTPSFSRISEDIVKEDMELLYSIFSGPFASLLNSLSKHSALYIQRKLLKVITMDMINDSTINMLIEQLGDKRIQLINETQEFSSQSSITEFLNIINGQMVQFREHIEVASTLLQNYTKRLSYAAILFTSSNPVDIVLKHQKQSVECSALWYKLTREIQENRRIFEAFDFIRENLKELLLDEVQSPETIRIYGKGISAIDSSLKHLIWDDEKKNLFMGEMQRLHKCIRELERALNDEVVSTNITMSMEDSMEIEMGYNVKGDIGTVLTLGYLYRSLNDVEHMHIAISSWMNELNMSSQFPDGKNEVALHALSKIEAIYVKMKKHINRGFTVFDSLRTVSFKARLLGSFYEQAKSDEGCENIETSIDEIHVSFYTVRALLMEFYEQIFILKSTVKFRVKVFDEYNLFGAALNLVNKAHESWKTNIAAFQKYKADITKHYDDFDKLKMVLQWFYRDIPIPDMYLPHSNAIRQRDTMKVILLGLDVSDVSSTTLTSLISDLGALIEKYDESLMESALYTFFTLRASLHRLLLLDASMCIINVLSTTLDADIAHTQEVSDRFRLSKVAGTPSNAANETKESEHVTLQLNRSQTLYVLDDIDYPDTEVLC